MTYLVALAWICAAVGLGLACLISLAAAMKTAPRRTPGETLTSAFLPAVAALLSACLLWRCWPLVGVAGFVTHLGPAVLAVLGLLVALAPMTRRGSSLFVHETRTLSDGRKVIADSPRNWRHDEPACRQTALAETAGGAPPGGAPDWPSYWYDLLARARQFHENPVRYAELVARVRREVGLGDLPPPAV